MDTDKDKDIDLDLELEVFSKISIQCYRFYRAVWISWNTPWRKFQQHYKLVVLLPDENYSDRRWICSLNDVLAELEISVYGVINRLLQ
jgi:hypothetical protein